MAGRGQGHLVSGAEGVMAADGTETMQVREQGNAL